MLIFVFVFKKDKYLKKKKSVKDWQGFFHPSDI